MTFLFIIVIICIVILFIMQNDVKSEIKSLRKTIDKLFEENSFLKKEIQKLKNDEAFKEDDKAIIFERKEEETPPTEVPIISLETKPYFTPIEIPKEEVMAETPVEPIHPPIKIRKSEEESITTTPFAETKQVEETTDFSVSQKSAPITEPEKPKTPSDFSIAMSKLEKQFADNWTGILGTAIMVLGIGYLSIYTALKVSPLFRVLILWLYAGLLVGSYYLLKKKEKWEKTGLWLRSAGASLFLFGCFGASQIPALTFINSTLFGYLLIGIGIGVNLFVGYIIKKQTFLSLHVILSMLILCVIPDKLLITFLLAALTSIIGIVLSYKEKWEYHLLAVIGAFIIFDIWFNLQGPTLSKSENMFAILGIISVAASCIIMQYRNVYNDTTFDKAGFATHLVNWMLFVTGLILHSTGNRFKVILLFVGAVICFFMAVHARKKKVVWLYHLDGMVSFILLALSIILLNEWNVGFDIIASILYIITLFVMTILFKEKEILLHKIFLGINHVLVLVLIIICLNLKALNTTIPLLSLILLTFSGMAMAVFGNWKKEYLGVDAFLGNENLSINGLFSIAISILVLTNWNNTLGMSYFYVVLILGITWSLLHQKIINFTFDIGRLFYLLFTIALGTIIIYGEKKSLTDLFYFIGIGLIFYLNWKDKVFKTNDFLVRFILILGGNLIAFNFTYKYIGHYHIGFLLSFIGLALINFEFMLWQTLKKSMDSIHQKLLFVAFYFYIILASLLLLFDQYSFTPIEIGSMILVLSIAEVYVLFIKRVRLTNQEEVPSWNLMRFGTIELLVFNGILFGFYCLAILYIPVFIGFCALLTYYGSLKFDELKKFHYYSMLLLCFAVVLTVYNAITQVTATNQFVVYGTQLATILLSFGYSYLQFKSNEPKEKEFQIPLSYIQNLWIIGLLFIQVELAYLSLLFMILAVLNFYLIYKEKLKINPDFVSLVGFISIAISVFYSIYEFHNFEILDWILQLSSVVVGIILVIIMHEKQFATVTKNNYQIVINGWISILMFTQLEHKWLPIFWIVAAIINLFLYYKIASDKKISLIYYFLANVHLAFVSFLFYETQYLPIYLLMFLLLSVYVYLAYQWMENFINKNSLLIYPITASIGCFLYLSFDKGILTFFWVLEALGLLILGIILKEKFFRYVSLSLVGLCVVRLLFFDLSNTDFLIRALVLLGVGIVLLVMNSLFKKYKDRFE